jgi:hypothetical protein
MRQTLSLVAVLFVAAAVPVAAQYSQGSAADSIKAIDTECNAIQSAIQALKPIHVAFIDSKWKVVSDADLTVAQQTNASATFADVWKQGKNYAWVHSHSVDAKGSQRATQLCFRQKDGTLERARQAATVPDLSAAAAETAFYAPNGTVLQKTQAFEVNDPAIAKKISDLPYYKQLP